MKHNKMVQSIIDIGENEDRIINIVKAEQGFKNKSQAVAFMAKKYEDAFLEPELNSEFFNKLSKIKKEKRIRFSDISELRRHLGKNA